MKIESIKLALQDKSMGDAAAIVCPSGLSGTVRGLKVREEAILADRRLAKSGQQMNALLAACWLETSSSGPYDFAGAPDWEKVLIGDRFFALLKIRALTYGDAYDFTVDCRNQACRRRIPWSLSLDDLPVRELPATSRDALVANVPLEVRLPSCGKLVRFRLATGADERRVTTMLDSQRDHALSTMLTQRIVEVEGVSRVQVASFVEDLSMRDANFMVSHFESVDCGVQTSIEVECQRCGHIQELDLPLEAGFLWPSKREICSPSGSRSS